MENGQNCQGQFVCFMNEWTMASILTNISNSQRSDRNQILNLKHDLILNQQDKSFSK